MRLILDACDAIGSDRVMSSGSLTKSAASDEVEQEIFDQVDDLWNGCDPSWVDGPVRYDGTCLPSLDTSALRCPQG